MARREEPSAVLTDDERLWGWDHTPGIVSVWADGSGTATIWRRRSGGGVLLRETATYRPWVLTDTTTGLDSVDGVSWRELDGVGALRYHVSATTERVLRTAVMAAVSAQTGARVEHISQIDKSSLLSLPPDEQYLVSSGRAYFRGLTFDDLRRMQFDLETTGLDPQVDRIFMVATRSPEGRLEILEADSDDDRGEAGLIRRLLSTIQAADPDVIENHNLHGFDLPFLETRARRLGVAIRLGRIPTLGLRQRAARRGAKRTDGSSRRIRFIAPGRELIDTLDAVQRYDFALRELPGHGLKAVARHLGVAGPDRELIAGDRIYEVYQRDPDRVRRYASADVEEVDGIARLLGGAAFALARMAPRRYERLADAGAATGIIDPLLVRAYVRAGQALPAHQAGDGTPHTGAALYLFATGVASRVVKADVASLYPSLMRAFRIGPAGDRLGALLSLVDGLVEHRFAAKARAKAAAPGSAERHENEAVSAAMKLVVNSAYGYLAAGEGLTRFADVHAANDVTRRGRETLAMMCRELSNRGVTLLEADTDGVYFSVPEAWTEADERRIVAEVDALLPGLVTLEYEGRYAAMLSHEPKNYALLGYDGSILLKGVAFRSSRAEPFGETFLRQAAECLLKHDVPGIRRAYLDALFGLRHRTLPTSDVSSRVRLTKTPEQYAAGRNGRRESTYEALLTHGRTHWSLGERIRVYRTTGGGSDVASDVEDDRRNYDVDHYTRVLRKNFASRLARAFTPEDYEIVFAEPEQPSLFEQSLEKVVSILRHT